MSKKILDFIGFKPLLLASVISLALIIMYFKIQCNNRVYNAVIKYAPDAKSVLDLGCGQCCTTTKLKDRV